MPLLAARCWQSGWHDFGVMARYNLLAGATGRFALTPSVSLGVPSHDYNFRGEAALGHNLRAERTEMLQAQEQEAKARRRG
jgi:hypothetical protein